MAKLEQNGSPKPDNGGQVTVESGTVKPVPGGYPGDPTNDAPQPPRGR
jgi:hypothetical protein